MTIWGSLLPWQKAAEPLPRGKWTPSGWKWLSADPDPFQAAEKPQDEAFLDVIAEPPLDIIARGEAARRLLNDPTLRAALDEIEQVATEMWKACKPEEVVRREECFRTVKSIQLLRDRLRTFRDTAAVRRVQQEAETAA